MSSLPSGLHIEKFEWYQILAVVSGVILVLSLFYPVQGIENGYVTCIASGLFLFSVIEWSQWGRIMERHPTGILTYPAKRTAWYHILLKIIALILVVVPLLELGFGIEIIPFPK